MLAPETRRGCVLLVPSHQKQSALSCAQWHKEITLTATCIAKDHRSPHLASYGEISGVSRSPNPAIIAEPGDNQYRARLKRMQRDTQYSYIEPDQTAPESSSAARPRQPHHTPCDNQRLKVAVHLLGAHSAPNRSAPITRGIPNSCVMNAGQGEPSWQLR